MQSVTPTLVKLDRADKVISETKLTLNEVSDLENYEIVRVSLEHLPTIAPFDEYHSFKKFDALKDCYSAKKVKEALQNLRDYERTIEDGIFGTVRSIMYLDEISENLSILELYHTIKGEDCGKVSFICNDLSTNLRMRLLLENTNFGISALCFAHLSNQVREADLVPSCDQDTDKTKVLDILNRIKSALGLSDINTGGAL